LHFLDITQQTDIFSKLELLALHIHNTSKKFYIPASNVSIDEMIAQFSRRSAYTFHIKNKLTPERYKILSLCELGYTYTFLFMLRIKSSNVNTIANINKTGVEVFYLVK